jgi:hypothetical protein
MIMNSSKDQSRIGWSAVLVLWLSSLSALASEPGAQQNFLLRPGWNAIWLEVRPADNSTAAVFANLPVASVWTRAERLSSVDFIQNPSEQAFNEAGWLGWFHPSRCEAFLGNLFTVQANRAYLIKLTNSTPINWGVTGRPSLRAPEWVPDAYNLRGLPVDPAAPPTFLSFFRHSKAHYDTAGGQLQKIYRLNAGQWTLAASGDAVTSGEAYWIYTKGASDYVAPLTPTVGLGDGLDFGTELTELDLRLANKSAGAMNALVKEINANGPGAVSYYQFVTTIGGQWPNLPGTLVQPLAAGAETRMRLAIRRQSFGANGYASILEIRDGAGTRLRVPVVAARGSADVPGGPVSEAQSHAGLWVGSATINAVSEAHAANPAHPTPTKSEMNLRLLLHVNTNGQTRLLKEVIQMWRDGTYTNDGSGNLVVDKPGRYVLLTDDTLIGQFQGATLRDGESVGRRLSTVGYDFPSTPGNNYLNVSGSFAAGQTLSATLTLPHDHPNNPFKHKYHPDHDNLNARFDGPAVESFTVRRQVRLQLTASPPPGPAVPDYGYDELGGNYSEVITGLHKNPIHVAGTFRLRRAAHIAELNPSPTP